MSRSLIVAILASLIIGIGVGYALSYREISELQSEVTSLELEVSTLIADYNNLNTTYNNLKDDYKSLNSTHNELLAQHASLQGDYASLVLTYHGLQLAYELLEQLIEYEVDVLLDEEYYYSVKNDLENANNTIFVAMYSMIYDSDDTFDWASDLIRELVNAKDRGVTVNVLIENRTFFGYMNDNLEAYNYLLANGVNVQLDQDTDTDHMKFVVIDDDIAYVGSHNWSESGLYYNSETSVKIVSETIAEEFRAYFETI